MSINSEVWLPVEGFPGYYVSSHGRVRGKRADILKHYLSKKGYANISMWRDGKAVRQQVHRMVAIAFLPNPENKATVNHKDGDKTNNRTGNLECWMFS